jgi:hypothetical protein
MEPIRMKNLLEDPSQGCLRFALWVICGARYMLAKDLPQRDPGSDLTQGIYADRLIVRISTDTSKGIPVPSAGC